MTLSMESTRAHIFGSRPLRISGSARCSLPMHRDSSQIDLQKILVCTSFANDQDRALSLDKMKSCNPLP